MLDARKVRARREALTLTQGEAAKRAGFETYQQWARLEQENRDPRASTLAKIAHALRCKIEDLLTD
jgi:transcriptional regulator with XRE-family HTH domain